MNNYNENSIDSKITLLLERGMADLKDKEEFRADILARLSRIEEHCEHTNGSIADAQRDIADLNRDREAIREVVGFKNLIQRYILNRYFLVLLGIASIGAFKVVSNPELRELFLRILGL